MTEIDQTKHIPIYYLVCYSFPSIEGEHIPIPGHDNAEGPQNDSGRQTRGSHSVRGLHQSAHFHHGCQPNTSDVRAS